MDLESHPPPPITHAFVQRAVVAAKPDQVSSPSVTQPIESSLPQSASLSNSSLFSLAECIAAIRQSIEQDGALDIDDAMFLIHLLGEADEVCSEFDELFMQLMRHVFLKDGKIDLQEQTALVEMLGTGETIRESQKKLLHDLQIEAKEVTPGFKKWCDAVLSIPS